MLLCSVYYALLNAPANVAGVFLQCVESSLTDDFSGKG